MATTFDSIFKFLLVGDTAVGNSSLLLRFTDDVFTDLPPTIGVDFKIKVLDVGGKLVKLTIWDTAGQERFRTLTSSYYRGAQGIILVYDVTQPETFENLSNWLKEVDVYAPADDTVKLLIANKIDKENRQVSRKEGEAFARSLSMLYIECSAKTKAGVQQAFEELVQKILDTPSLNAPSGPAGNPVDLERKQSNDGGGCGC